MNDGVTTGVTSAVRSGWRPTDDVLNVQDEGTGVPSGPRSVRKPSCFTVVAPLLADVPAFTPEQDEQSTRATADAPLRQLPHPLA